MFDQLVRGAPFAGNIENIGHALQTAAHNAPVPGAYLLIGDESSDDTIKYTEIPSPVFTLPLGRNDQDTQREYRTLAEKTHGKMLQLDFKYQIRSAMAGGSCSVRVLLHDFDLHGFARHPAKEDERFERFVLGVFNFVFERLARAAVDRIDQLAH